MNHAREVLDVAFPSGDQAAEDLQPRKEPLDLPAALGTAQLAPILGLGPAPAVGRDRLDADRRGF